MYTFILRSIDGNPSNPEVTREVIPYSFHLSLLKMQNCRSWWEGLEWAADKNFWWRCLWRMQRGNHWIIWKKWCRRNGIPLEVHRIGSSAYNSWLSFFKGIMARFSSYWRMKLAPNAVTAYLGYSHEQSEQPLRNNQWPVICCWALRDPPTIPQVYGSATVIDYVEKPYTYVKKHTEPRSHNIIGQDDVS